MVQEAVLLVDDCRAGKGKRQRHCVAEVPSFRRIVISRVAERKEVNGYPDLA
jgi:hypothetical protein